MGDEHHNEVSTVNDSQRGQQKQQQRSPAYFANGRRQNGAVQRTQAGEPLGNVSAGQSSGELPGSRGTMANEQQYAQLVQQLMPQVNKGALLLRSFVVGGTLSLIGQFVLDFFTRIEPTQGQAFATTLATMILLGAILTAFGVYDRLGEWGGFGAAVPITGFANSMVSAAMDFRREGFILGMGSKMFIVAGPVIVFGILAGMATGTVAWLVKAVMS